MNDTSGEADPGHTEKPFVESVSLTGADLKQLMEIVHDLDMAMLSALGAVLSSLNGDKEESLIEIKKALEYSNALNGKTPGAGNIAC